MCLYLYCNFSKEFFGLLNRQFKVISVISLRPVENVYQLSVLKILQVMNALFLRSNQKIII